MKTAITITPTEIPMSTIMSGSRRVVIRSILVPAIMQLLGRSAWWMPEWLSKILPNLGTLKSEF